VTTAQTRHRNDGTVDGRNFTLAGKGDLQKIFYFIGPPRSGKGTVVGVLRNLLGAHNITTPAASSFGLPFGRASLIGKLLAVVTDARFSGKTNKDPIIETLLSISGKIHKTGQTTSRSA
jgi:putative DNA primase/helicase